MLTIHDLGVRFGGHRAVDGVSCRFRQGEITAVVGPNGAGKTTLFNLISGQVRAGTGRIELLGRNITRLGVGARARLGIARGFQRTTLFPGLTVLENVRLVAQARAGRGFRMLRRADADRQVLASAREVLDQCGLTPHAGRLTTELSHGAQRKLKVAMLMATAPRVFMFDEPTAGMSTEEAPGMLRLIDGLRRDRSLCVLLVEHRIDVIRALADRIVVLQDGRCVADGTPAMVMDSAAVRAAYMGQELVADG
jgi:branched-chain amino acid transport system ATP-binding protein